MRAQIAQVNPVETDYAKMTDRSNGLSESSTGVVYGYVRTSARDGGEEGQLTALHAAGVSDDCIFADVAVMTGYDRAEYSSLLQALKPGDLVVIASLDKLGTTYDDVISQWQLITKGKRAHLTVLDIPLLDTRLRHPQLSDDYIADLALQFLAYVATREREGIRQRQREGILAAKERGVRFGRPPKPVPPQFETLLQQWRSKEISSRKAAQQLGVAQETFLRWARRRG